MSQLTQSDKEILIYAEETLIYMTEVGCQNLNKVLNLIRKPNKNNLIRALSILTTYVFLLEDKKTEKVLNHTKFMLNKLQILSDFEY
jgi:hypothetical protein